ncbi:hypothetical protein DPMN_046161 [Dreissena polymorpha]|uniref:Uncharacterized protein n=1 Tax=Dreissena polymorpha TaxID=45954 RepID=A0A9D4I0A6_DREPO|nr:hypothetical protein DPMN_046161 [Dreissena polymorpha]
METGMCGQVGVSVTSHVEQEHKHAIERAPILLQKMAALIVSERRWILKHVFLIGVQTAVGRHGKAGVLVLKRVEEKKLG